MKSGFNTVRLHWSKTGICSVLTLGASLGLIIFTVLNHKSEKTVESPQELFDKFAHRNSLGSSHFPLGLRPSGKSDESREFPKANFSRQPLQTFQCLYHAVCGTPWACHLLYMNAHVNYAESISPHSPNLPYSKGIDSHAPAIPLLKVV